MEYDDTNLPLNLINPIERRIERLNVFEDIFMIRYVDRYIMSQEFDFYSLTDMSNHAGEWVAILGREIIASGKDLKEVYKEAKKKAGNREPMFARVPKEQETLIL